MRPSRFAPLGPVNHGVEAGIHFRRRLFTPAHQSQSRFAAFGASGNVCSIAARQIRRCSILIFHRFTSRHRSNSSLLLDPVFRHLSVQVAGSPTSKKTLSLTIEEHFRLVAELDFKTRLPLLGFRLEVRDFITGRPGTPSFSNVSSDHLQQHLRRRRSHAAFLTDQRPTSTKAKPPALRRL